MNFHPISNLLALAASSSWQPRVQTNALPKIAVFYVLCLCFECVHICTMHLTKSSHASKSFNGKNTFMQNALGLRLFAKNSYIDANFADE